MDHNTEYNDQKVSGQNTNQTTEVADAKVTQQSLNQSYAGSETDVFHEHSDKNSYTDSQANDDSFVVLNKDDCVDSDNNTSNLNIASLDTEFKFYDQNTSKDGEDLKSEESKGGAKGGHEIHIEEKTDNNKTSDEIRHNVAPVPKKLENNEESTMSDKNIRCIGKKHPTNSEDVYLCPDSVEEDTAQNPLKSTIDNSKYVSTEVTENICSGKSEIDFESEKRKIPFSDTSKTTEHQLKNRSEAPEKRHATISGDFENLESVGGTSSEHSKMKDVVEEKANTSGQQGNDADIVDEQKEGKDKVTEIAKTDCREPKEVSNVRQSDEKVLKKQSMATVSTTSKPNVENFTTDEKLLEVTGTFGVVKLLKVSKFWFIALNGQKSKVPEPAFQDPSIRLEVQGEDILLVTDSHCYKVKINEDKLRLKVFDSYFSKAAAEKYDVKVNDCSKKCSKNDTIGDGHIENQNENEAESGKEKQTLVNMKKVKENYDSSENKKPDLERADTCDKSKVVNAKETVQDKPFDPDGSNNAPILPMQDKNIADFKTTSTNKNGQQKDKEVDKGYDQTAKQVQLLDREPKHMIPKEHIQGKVEGNRSNEFPDAKEMMFKQAEAGLVPEESQTGTHNDEIHEEKMMRSQQSDKVEDQEKPEEKSQSKTVAKNQGEGESLKAENENRGYQWQNFQQNEVHIEPVHENDNISDSNYQSNRKTERIPNTPFKTDDTDDESAVDELSARLNSTHIADTEEQEPFVFSTSPKKEEQSPSKERKDDKPNRIDQDMQTNKVKRIYPDLTNLVQEGAMQFGKREDISTGKQINEDHVSGNQSSRMASKVIELPRDFPWQRLLQKFDVLSHLKQLLKSLEVEVLNIGQMFSIKFTGIERDTEYAVKYIQDEAVARVCKEQVMLSFQSMAVFQHTHICEMLEHHLRDIVLVFEENQKLYVWSFDKENCRTAKLRICNLVSEKTIPLTGQWRTEAGFKTLTDKISVNQECVYVSRNTIGTSITITGLKNGVEELNRDITSILQGKATQKERNMGELIPRKINYCELKYFLDPCDVWLQLSMGFQIEENLRQIAPSADVQLRKIKRENGHVCELVITGSEEQAEAAVQKFKREYRDNLWRREVPLKDWQADLIRNTNICIILNRRFPKVVLTMENSNLICYTFDKHVASETSEQICRLITKETIILHGDWKKKELMKDLQEEIVRTYEGVYVVPDYDCGSLLVAGFKEGVAKATQHMISKIKTDPQVSHRYKIENQDTFQVLMKDAEFLSDLRKNFEVETMPDIMQQSLEIKGVSSDVEKCTREIDFYCKSVITKSREKVVQDSEYVASKAFQELLDKVGEQNQVKIERSLRGSQRAGIQFQDEKSNRKCFLFPNGQKLILINPVSAESGSDFIVKVSEESHNVAGYTRQFSKGQAIIQMEHPYYCQEGAVQRTQEVIKKILTTAREDKEKVVEFKVPLLTTWSIDDMIGCWIRAIYEYFMESGGGQNPRFVILSPWHSSYYQYAVDCCKIHIDKINFGAVPVMSTKQPRFKISVVPGKLDETVADVLVNTASFDGDLKKGAVSNALLQTAGPQLQSEVLNNHPSNLSSGQLVITKGYKLRCSYVFHGALPGYDSHNMEKSRKELHRFMMTCLFKANYYLAESIAFPAIGAGNLKYPIKDVVTEMFAAVNEFERNGYPISLQEVYFVIFPGDVTAVDAFKKRAEVEKKQAIAAGESVDSSRSGEQSICLHLTITGHKDNVAKAYQRIDADLFGKSQESSSGARSKTYSEVVRTKSFKGSSEASSQTPRPTGTAANTSTTPEISGRSNSVQGPVICTTDEGLIVRVYNANILHLHVDCIVNAADEKLNHEAGLARTIAMAAGSGFIKECENYVKKFGLVPTGNAVKTGAGKLYYQLIIHAVGPEWYLYRPYTEKNVMACLDSLKKAVISSLKLAEESRMRTVAMPAISAGIFAVPKELCAMEYAKAVMEFSSAMTYPPRCLKEVHFVDTDPSMVGFIEQAFTQMVQNKNKSPWDWRMYVQREQGVPVNRPKTQQQDQSTFSTFPQFLENGDCLTCKFTQKRMVFILKDDIFNFNKADALVCSEDTTGKAAGGVARLLLQKAGKQYEIEKTQKYKEQKPKMGEVVITRGGNSGFQWIIHAIMPHPQVLSNSSSRGEKRWKESLTNMIDKILDTAYERRYKILVMSLLGTGAGSSDPKQSAEVLYDCFTKSCVRHMDSQFVLHVVNNDAGRNQIVKETFKKHVTAAKQLLGATAEVPKNIHQRSDQSFIREEKKTTAVKDQTKNDESKCPICLDVIKYPKHLACGHVFCETCISKSLKEKAVCPVCGKVLGVIYGDQPDGDMIIENCRFSLPGFRCHTIKIIYTFYSGTQGKNHANPGKRYQGMTRSAYLPDNKDGRVLCAMLKLAFERRLVFTIGRSRTTGHDDVITWNDIHHKTNLTQNSQYGYPDPGYLNRLKEELAAKGVKEDDPKLDKSFLGKLDTIGKVTVTMKEQRSRNIVKTSTV